jgi:hypothetical protein
LSTTSSRVTPAAHGYHDAVAASQMLIGGKSRSRGVSGEQPGSSRFAFGRVRHERHPAPH